MVQPEVDPYTERKARIAERTIKADKLAGDVGMLKTRGLSFHHISDHLHVPLSTVHKAWNRHRKSLQRGNCQEERELAISRLEMQYVDLQLKLRAGDPAAHRAATEIVALMADLQGLAMPTQVEVHGQPSFTRFEFVVEPLREQATVELEGDAQDGPRLEDGERRMLGPAKVAATVEVAS
jgi:hypothetical protein